MSANLERILDFSIPFEPQLLDTLFSIHADPRNPQVRVLVLI